MYITISDVRDAGITESQASDAVVTAFITRWSQFVDLQCRQWFEPRDLDLYIDGTGARYLWFRVPIIEITALYMNSDWTNVIPEDEYVVYNNLGNGLKDDRRNPRIGLADYVPTSSSFFARPIGGGLFIKAKKNQRVVGRFGFVESDESTPLMISQAVLRLVVRELSGSSIIAPPDTPAGGGVVISETTDGHTKKYASDSGGSSRSYQPYYGITNDPFVDGVLAMYRAPIAIGVVE